MPERWTPLAVGLLVAGFHFEIRGCGTSSRGDVDALAHRLPLRALAGD